MKRNPLLPDRNPYRDGETCGSGPSCWLLLHDPATVLLNKEYWPTHLCPNMMKFSTWYWAANDHRAWHEVEDVWPLPVGAQAAREFLWHSLEDESDPDAPAVHVTGEDIAERAPFNGNEQAALAIRVEIGGAPMDLFGLCELHVAGNGRVSYPFTELVYALPGVPPDQKLLAQLWRQASRWWRTEIRKLPMPSTPDAGQPPALQGRSVESVVNELAEFRAQYIDEYGTEPTVRFDYTRRLGIKRTAFYEFFKRQGTTWRRERPRVVGNRRT
jgi:hypothetical protein